MEDQKRLIAGSIYYCLHVVSFVSRGHVSVADNVYTYGCIEAICIQKSTFARPQEIWVVKVDRGVAYSCW